MKRTIYFLLIFSYAQLFAQYGEDIQRSAPSHFSPITFETIPYWSEDTTSIDLVVFYRIDPKLFFFSKTFNSQHDFYKATGELVFEIYNEKDESVAREFRPLLIERNSLPAEGVQFSEDIQGAFSFHLQKGLYKVVVETKDNESEKSFINRDTKIDARTFSRD